MITPALFPAAMRRGYDAVAIIGYKYPKTLYPTLTRMWRAKGRFVEATEYGELDLLQDKRLGASVEFTIPEEGYTGRWYPVTMGLGLEFPHETMADDGVGICKQYIRRLSSSVPKTIEHFCARLYNYGDATTYHSTPSGVALFSTTHKLTPTGPATFVTKMTPAVLAAQSLQAALTTINTRKDEFGVPIDETPVRLIHPPNLQFKVAELLKSTHSPEDDARHINPVFTEYNLKPVMWKYLTAANNWFIQCEEHGLNFILREPARTGQGYDVASGNRLYVVVIRFVFGIKHPRGVLGCIN